MKKREEKQKTAKVVRVGLAMERESVFARRVLQGVNDAATEFARQGEVFDLRFLHDRLLRDTDDVATFDAFIAQVQDDAAAQTLVATGKPVIDVLFRQAHAGCAVVNADNVRIARLAAEHFIDRNFEHFAFCGRDGVSYSDERGAAFAAALAEKERDCLRYEVPASKQRKFFLGAQPRGGEAVEDPADDAYLQSWAKSLPSGTAVFCCQDLRAYQLCHACYRVGRRVPDDVAILGVDDDPIFCSFTDPRISSIDPDAEAVGREALRAVARLLGKRGGRFSVRDLAPCFVPPRGLTIRESTDLFRSDPPWLGKARSFLSRNFAVPSLSVDDVIRHVGKSHTLVDRAFRRVLGTSVRREIMRLRLDQAAKLLRETDLPVKDVAAQSGFATFPHFCASFRHRFGKTAEALRG